VGRDGTGYHAKGQQQQIEITSSSATALPARTHQKEESAMLSFNVLLVPHFGSILRKRKGGAAIFPYTSRLFPFLPPLGWICP
jgi:hypothetical protein